MPRTLIQVSVKWPDQITWTFDDGSIEKTVDDVTTIGGRTSIAIHAEKLGLGNRKANFSVLGGPDGWIEKSGVLLEQGPFERRPDRSPKSAAGRTTR